MLDTSLQIMLLGDKHHVAATKGAARVSVFSGQLTVKMALWNNARVEQARTITLYLQAQMKKSFAPIT